MSDLDEFLTLHTVTVRPYLGQDTDGSDLHGPQVTIPCFLEETSRLVRSPDGSETTSTAQAYTQPGTSVPLDSEVTLPSGRVTHLLSIERRDSGQLGLPDHVTLNLE